MTDRTAIRLYRRMNRGRITHSQYFNILWNTGACYDPGQYARIMNREHRRQRRFVVGLGIWCLAIQAAWIAGGVPSLVCFGVVLATLTTFFAMAGATSLRIRHLDRE